MLSFWQKINLSKEKIMSYIHQAKFISGPAEWGKHCPKFLRRFSAREAVRSAVLEISALGVYECFINGERVGDFYMAPGWTVYPERVQYQSYDVTDMLRGENEIVIGVGHGWFASRLGAPTSTRGVYGQYPAVIATLHIEYVDGEENIVTDGEWLVGKSEITKSQIYDGESCDAQAVTEYSQNAEIYEYSTTLIAHEGEYVRETERIRAKEVIITPRGDTVLDFGQEVTGVVEFVIENAKGGETVKIECAEILDKNGEFYNGNYRSAESLIEYTAKAGRQVYKPHYTFFGFRYLRLTDWCEEVRPERFTAVVMHSDIKRTGYFECGHEKINKLYSNIVWGQRGNFLDIPTDCPQRDERLGWTGDAQVFCRTAAINYDVERFFRKWLRDVAIEQRESGAVPATIPFPFADYSKTRQELSATYVKASAAWGDVATVCPFEIYVAYGDRQLLREFYPMMKKWVEFMHASGDEEYLWLGGNHYGDWLGLDAPSGSYKGSTDEDLIATAFYYYSTGLLIKAARVIGVSADEIAYYDDMRAKVKAAFAKRFINGDRLTSDTQTAYVLTLHFGLYPSGTREAFARRLVELIEENGCSLTTGFVGTPYLLDTLTEIGRKDLAYKLLLREEYPGWLFSVNMGATTVWEHWDGLREDGSVWSEDMNSFNHYAYGSVASWIYRVCAGIRPDENEPAYKHFYIEPVPCRALGYAKAKIDSRAGEIVSEWRYEGDSVRYHFTVPEGAIATVTIDGITKDYSAGDYSF